MDYLYKYTKISAASKILEKRVLRVSNPKDFNDPFDSLQFTSSKQAAAAKRLLLNYHIEQSLKEYLGLKAEGRFGSAPDDGTIYAGLIEFEKSCVERGAYFLNPFIENLLHHSEKIPDPRFISAKNYMHLLDKCEIEREKMPERLSNLLKIPDGVRDLSWLTCFSQNCTSILMWSHYSDSHRGVCLRFSGPFDSDHFRAVHYSDKRSSFHAYRLIAESLAGELSGGPFSIQVHTRKNLVSSLVHKAKDWQYEEEVRYVATTEDLLPSQSTDVGKFIKLPCPISEVIFGAKCDMDVQ